MQDRILMQVNSFKSFFSAGKEALNIKKIC